MHQIWKNSTQFELTSPIERLPPIVSFKNFLDRDLLRAELLDFKEAYETIDLFGI